MYISDYGWTFKEGNIWNANNHKKTLCSIKQITPKIIGSKRLIIYYNNIWKLQIYKGMLILYDENGHFLSDFKYTGKNYYLKTQKVLPKYIKKYLPDLEKILCL